MSRRLWAQLIAILAVLSSGLAVADEKSPRPGEVREFEIAGGVKMKFGWVPPGEVQLGAPEEEQNYVVSRYFKGDRANWLDAESEAKRGKFVTKGFWLGKYMVTQGDWRAVMGGNPSWFSKSGNGSANIVDVNTIRFPVEQVSWKDCGKFLAKLNDRGGRETVFGQRGKFVLPHENEWEYACRGGRGNKTPFYFGEQLNGTQANCDARGNPSYVHRFPITKNYAKTIARLNSPLRVNIGQAVELPLSSWMQQFMDNLQGTGFYIRVNEESLERDDQVFGPIKVYGDESPRVRIGAMPRASLDRVMTEILAQMNLTYLVNEDHLEILRTADVDKRVDRSPTYFPGSPPSENYKKAVARLKSECKPGVNQGTELRAISWLSEFQNRLEGTKFFIRINDDSVKKQLAVEPFTGDSPRIRIQSLPGATLESVMVEVFWKQGLTFSVKEDYIEIIKRSDAKTLLAKTEIVGIGFGRPTEVWKFEDEVRHPWGLCDMHGNVWQWCENWYDGEQTKRVLRGGSWNASPADCRAAHRFGADPERRANDTGFRVCFRPD